MKLTLHDIIVLHLAETPGFWLPSYNLEKVNTSFGWIGHSGARRARELAEAGSHVINGATYFIERRMNGKYAEYRVASSKPRLRQQVEHLPNGDVRVSYV